MKIIEANSNNLDMYLYDYQQLDYEQERKDKWYAIVNNIENLSPEEYRDLKKQFHWEDKFGIYTPMPENITEYEIKQFIKQKKGE